MPAVKEKKAVKKKTELGEHLDACYLAWRDNQPDKRGAFSQWAKEVVKLDENILKSYVNRGSKPNQKMVEILAEKFGPIVYVKAGMFPPDDRLKRIANVWWKLSDDIQIEIAEMADQTAQQSTIGPCCPGVGEDE